MTPVSTSKPSTLNTSSATSNGFRDFRSDQGYVNPTQAELVRVPKDLTQISPKVVKLLVKGIFQLRKKRIRGPSEATSGWGGRVGMDGVGWGPK